MAPWSALKLDLRESSCQQANAIPSRLRDLDMYMAEYDPAKADQEVRNLPPDKIDELAQGEHERYVEERLTGGWQPGARNTRSSTTPFLVPWSDVPEHYREYDRHIIAIIPSLLNAVGYRIYRMPKVVSILADWDRCGGGKPSVP
jgi:RyR domain